MLLTVGKEAEQLEPSRIMNGGYVGTATLENYWSVSTKLHINVLHYPEFLILHVCPTEMFIYMH